MLYTSVSVIPEIISRIILNIYLYQILVGTSFVEAAKQDKSAPLMKNTQQVYAGMTYARGAVNEDYMDVDSHRGFFV